jgi:TrmH family RNA methyltransferase
MLSNVVWVLYEPQDSLNIGNVVRASKNFCIENIRLVRPAEFDTELVSVTGRKSPDLIESIEVFESLDEALADCRFVIATTARERSDPRMVTEPRGAAEKAIDVSVQHPVAYMFGREDHGLPNAAIDRAHSIVTIPANPEYTSLNLGQAVLLNIWECFRAEHDIGREQPDVDLIRPDTPFEPASTEGLERMLDRAEQSLDAIEFFKTETNEHIMRALRKTFRRAGLDERELSIWHGIFREITAYAERARKQDPEETD